MKLWYETPSSNWNEALPIGNGHIGGMIFGYPIRECIQLNDETIWYRGKSDRNNPDSLRYLKTIREHLLKGEITKAEELVKLAMFATPRDQSHYELLGELYIEHTNLKNENITNYKRELDLETAISSVTFTVGTGVEISREYYTSFHQNMLCCKISSSQPRGLNLTINLGRNKRFNDAIRKGNANQILMFGSAGGAQGVHFVVSCEAFSEDGTISVIGETIVIRECTQVYILLKSETDFWSELNEEFVTMNSFENGFNYESEKRKHVEKYQSQFNRVNFRLGKESEYSNLPTDYLLNNSALYKSQLINLLFHYGRYLLISSSQPGGLPANLQGIWCDSLNPIWGSKYTININTQMNYWMIGPCDLKEIEYPLFDLLEKLQEQGSVTAQKMYGARGFTAHHNTDGFGDTAPQSHAVGAAVWVMTVPWLATHIWEHYQYFKDKNILSKYFNIFKEAFQFIEDYLFEVNGYLLTGPSISPENKFRLENGVEGNVCLSPAIDNQILRFFCDSCIGVATELNDASDFVDRVIHLREKLPETRIGKHGQIQEWLEDYEEVEPGHRHISPLFGLYPYHEIDVETTPDLAAAARVTINRRITNSQFLSTDNREQAISDWLDSGLHASTQTGWSAAWLVHFFARLREGNAAVEQIGSLLENATLGNLFLDHPPFQIDGNLGLVSGICEMLLQSHNEALYILPALPDNWSSGYVEHLRTRGGYRVSLYWENNQVVKMIIENGIPNKNINCILFTKYGKEIHSFNFNSEGKIEFNQ